MCVIMIEKVLVTLCFIVVIILLTLAEINKADCAQTAACYTSTDASCVYSYIVLLSAKIESLNF